MMKESMVITLVAKDRPGLVETCAAVVNEHGGNWEESRMIRLAGEFAGLVHVQVPSDRADDLEKALGALDEISVTVARTVPGPSSNDAYFLKLEVVGHDHPGIVRRLSEAMADRQVSIEELETELVSAPMSGDTLFRAIARLRAPKSTGLEELTESLEQIAADLMVDITLEEPADA
jgi:glycine cleavage system regulatory protein